MKLVREHIFEKFEEDSDPITDMSIGIIGIINRLKSPSLFKSQKSYFEALVKVLPYILGTDGIPPDILGTDHAISWPYYYKITKRLDRERFKAYEVGEYLYSLGFKRIGEYIQGETKSKYFL